MVIIGIGDNEDTVVVIVEFVVILASDTVSVFINLGAVVGQGLALVVGVQVVSFLALSADAVAPVEPFVVVSAVGV